MCERFCCGPPVVCEPKQSPLSSDFYASELGRAAVEQGKKMEDAAGEDGDVPWRIVGGRVPV